MRTTRYVLIALLISFLVQAEASAQNAVVQVTLPDISAEPGTTVELPVDVSDVSGMDVTAMSVWMTYNPDVVTVTEIRIGPVSLSAGPEAGEPLTNIGPNGALEAGEARVSHATGGRPLTGEGNLFTYVVHFDDVGDANITFTRFLFNEGDPAVAIQGGNATVNNRPFVSDANLTLDEDSDGDVVTLLGNDADGDPLTFEVVAPPANGSVSIEGANATYVPDRDFFGSDQFTYRANDGVDVSTTATVRVTVSPVNDAPVFVSELGDRRIREGQALEFTYSATDVEGDAVAYQLVAGPAGATLDGATGTFAWTPTTDQAGEYVVQISASDGQDGVQSLAATITVIEAVLYAGSFSSVHLTSPVVSSGRGAVSLSYVPDDDEIILEGSFAHMTSGRDGARVYFGGFGENGTEVLPPIVSEDPDNPGSTNGEMPGEVNTLAISLITTVSGLSSEEIVAALEAGEVYVVIRSENHPLGELRAQLRPTGSNAAPSKGSVSVPAAVAIEGDPGAEALVASWTESTDGDGDSVRHAFGFWADAALTEMLAVYVEDGAFEHAYTVADLAELYEAAVGGSVTVGGMQTVYAAVLATDGSAITASDAVPVDLTRGLVTANETDGLVPETFMLRGNYPNPFNPTTTIQFDLPQAADVQVHVSDMLGRVVLSVPSQTMSAGVHRQVPIDAGALASGIYIYRVTARAGETVHVATGTMTLLK